MLTLDNIIEACVAKAGKYNSKLDEGTFHNVFSALCAQMEAQLAQTKARASPPPSPLCFRPPPLSGP